MSSVKLSPVFNEQVLTSAGAPASGWEIYTYAAGSTTPQTTYTDSNGTIPQANPIVLNALGFADSPIWLTAGQSYKFVLKDDQGVTQKTIDSVSGVNDTAVSSSQWVSSGAAPTYVSGTQFTLVGDQTTEFHVGRRLQLTVAAGTVYGLITASAYTTLTTVTIAVDSGSLDSGLSAVNLSILRADHQAIPMPSNQDIQLAAGKKIIFEGTTDDANEGTLSSGDPTADRTWTMPDLSGTVMMGDGSEVGDVIYSIRTSGRTGFLKADGKTIGDASSGATGLASADALTLFTALWNETSNTDYQIQTSGGVTTTRGASAAADWAAHKRMPLPDMRANFIRGLDAGAGVDTGRTNGSYQADELKSHTHTFAPGTSVAGSNTTFYGAATPINDGGGTTSATGGTETRPKNRAFTAWIRYLPYQS